MSEFLCCGDGGKMLFRGNFFDVIDDGLVVVVWHRDLYIYDCVGWFNGEVELNLCSLIGLHVVLKGM